MRRAIIFLTLACVAFAGPIEDEALQEFASGNRRFTAAVYKELIKSESGNIIVSPLSAETVLALTYEGAKGQTASQLVSGLSLPSTNEKTRKAFQSLLPRLKKSNKDLQLSSANKIYTGANVTLDEAFNTVATSVYDSGIENVDFAQNVKAAQKINGWVEEKTNHKISNLIDPNSLDKDTKLVLVNALYFSGKWENEFEDYATRKKTFYKTKEDTVDIDTMHQVEYFSYYENPTLNAKFLELPYKGADISMVVVLPNEIDGLASLEQNLEQVLQPQPFSTERVDLELPKFTIKTSIKFVPILQSLGIERAFEDDADFSGISSTDRNLKISDVIQKAFINVTETGTEAAAATAVVVPLPVSAIIDPIPIPKLYYFHADRPFLYYIKVSPVNTDDGIVFVIGRYNHN